LLDGGKGREILIIPHPDPLPSGRGKYLKGEGNVILEIVFFDLISYDIDMKNKPKFLIFDGNAIIHRSFHAMPPTMTTKTGEVVNAVYGFSSFLLKAIKEFKPAYVAVSFDLKGPTFRHEEYAEYKATRVKAPQELYDQFDRVKEVVRTLNIPIYEIEGFEADDVIGTVAHLIHDKIDTIIVTGDMDAIQLVDDSTFVYTMSRGISESVLYDESAVRARYQFDPIQLIDYKALRGDPSDNIPGVKGVGEKTATELIKEFGDIENLYNLITHNSQLVTDNIKPRILDLLKEHKDTAILSKRLATIRRDTPIDFNLENCRFGRFDLHRALDLFTELEFRSLLPRLKELAEDTTEPEVKFERDELKADYKLIDTDAKFKKFITELKKQKSFAFDSETTGLDNFSDPLLGMSFSWSAGEAYFVNLAGLNSGSLFAGTTNSTWLKQIAEILANAKIKKYGHNIKFDLKAVWSAGLDLQGIAGDSMIASYLLNPDNRQHSLEALALRELNFEKISKDELLGKGKAKINFNQVPLDKLALYASEDVDIAWRLTEKLNADLKYAELLKLYQEVELPLITVLARMENHGILVDKDYFHGLDKTIDKELAKLTNAIYELAGQEFNINSVQQLRQVLFEDLAISTKGIGKTKTGHSTGADELEKLKDAHPIIPLITEYRELAKLSSTYIKALPKLVNPKTGRLHTSYNQTIAATGRLSSTNPNLQNIPMKTDLGRQIRKGFVAPKGRVLLALDYSQIELRLAAHMTGDPTMIETFKTGGDIHRATAAKINNVKLEEVTSDMRRAAKAINFGLLYGQGPHGLATTAGITYLEARAFIDAYFTNFAKVKNYMEQVVVEAKEKGYVETLLGRRRYLPEINSSVIMLAKAAERSAINAPIQGTAADMIKVAMIEVDKMLEKEYQGKVKMILQVHDELVFELDKSLVSEVTAKIKPLMENVLKLTVPIEVDAKVGENWEEMESLRN